MNNKKIEVMMLGLRGFPNVQGGVETHSEKLCPSLVILGCDITVIVRKSYQNSEVGKQWKGVKFVSLWAPKSKGLEAIVHTFLGVLLAGIKRPDILHIQAIGPSIMTVFARLLGLKVVVTHHGPDYDRQKWGVIARLSLKLGELFGMRYSNNRIVISKVIADLVKRKHNQGTILIPNGVVIPDLPKSKELLNQFDLTTAKYILLVSRLVPEKRHNDLIDAFEQAYLPGWKLVLVGGADHPDDYELQLINKVSKLTNVKMTGFQQGMALKELYANAGFFVLPSSHEGLPIAMLEALSFGLPVLASDIPANLEVESDGVNFFSLGNVVELTDKLHEMSINLPDESDKANIRHSVIKNYNWDEIAKSTLQVYIDTINDREY